MNTDKPDFLSLWNKSAKYYSFYNDEYFPSKLKFSLLRKYSSPEFNCLDIGIANGIYSIPLSPFVNKIDGVDISVNMLEECNSKVEELGLKNIFLHMQSADNLDFSNEAFDLVFSFSTLGLVEDINKTLTEISRVLKPQRYAILDITGKKNLSRRHWENYYKSIGHFGLSYFDLSEVSNIFNQIGMSIIEKHSIGFLDQWKYIPIVRKFTFLEKVFHTPKISPDFDYLVSLLFPEFANHWFFVIRKEK